ncbi:MAG: ABC transporter ATP-binding protein [Roseiflexus sp.]|nr:ABC transporter ATP-binding protein [Roseiflexus sp.]MCS7287951.1 ABC transporter ATP-binding protein [Roseiflexus sp.]MDW8233929.1 ABC transporter ATP-binding protein [Roseiflexaceae bacterium]
MDVIELDEVHKSYDGIPVLRGVSLRVPQGIVYGMLGPHGAGKTTLIHLLLGFLRPDRGVIRMFGSNNLHQVDGRVGYVPERLRYHNRYTVREYLWYLGRFSGLSGATLRRRVDAEISACGLTSVANRPMSALSRGMVQRVGIAQALLSEPDLLLIDEPTASLDPEGQQDVIELLAAVRRRGCTILMATHFLDEADLLCDRIGILHGGRIIAEADTCTLQRPAGSVVITVADMPAAAKSALTALSPAVQCNRHEITLTPNTPELQAQVVRLLLDHGVTIMTLAPQRHPIEEFYLAAVSGHAKRDRSSEAPTSRLQGSEDVLLHELLRQEEQQTSEDQRSKHL